MFDEQLLLLLVGLSFVIKVIMDLIKQWTSALNLPDNFHRYTSVIIALCLGILMAYETDTTLLSAIGYTLKHRIVDIGITGLFLAGGSDVIYELINLIRTQRVS